MDRNDYAAFVTEMTGLAETFNREMTKGTLKGYWSALSDLPFDAFARAVARALRAADYMPVPAKLREMAGVTPLGSRAELAWEVCLRAIRSIGAYDSVDFADAAINGAVRSLGGWVSLCGRESEELLTFGRAAFLKAYPAFQGREGEAVAPVPGILEQSPDGRFKVKRVGCSYLEETPELAGAEHKRLSE